MHVQTVEFGPTLSSRRLFSIRRPMVAIDGDLSSLIAGDRPVLPHLSPDAAGYRIFSAPAGTADALLVASPGLVAGPVHRFARRYIAMAAGHDAWLAGFSAKTRSTFRRKVRRFADLSGGTLDLRCYRTTVELAQFFVAAAPLNRRTYQQRLLDAGLPEDAQFRSDAAAAARAGDVRAFLLFLDGRPVSYLYLTAKGATLHYDHLGYDPDLAGLSPGTVLQLEATRLLMEEGRFVWFDFGTGDGDHKRLFANGSVDCESFVLLRGTPANRMLVRVIDAVERLGTGAGAIADRLGVKARIRKALRRA